MRVSGILHLLVRDDLQLDLAAGTALDQLGDNWFVGAVVSLWPPR